LNRESKKGYREVSFFFMTSNRYLMRLILRYDLW
jgi:hypothetical protein